MYVSFLNFVLDTLRYSYIICRQELRLCPLVGEVLFPDISKVYIFWYQYISFNFSEFHLFSSCISFWRLDTEQALTDYILKIGLTNLKLHDQTSSFQRTGQLETLWGRFRTGLNLQGCTSHPWLSQPSDLCHLECKYYRSIIYFCLLFIYYCKFCMVQAYTITSEVAG